MLNSCNFTGYLVDTPKLLTGSDGINRTTFTLAVERDGTWKYDNEADYLDFVAWRESAKYIVKRFKKGDLMTVINARAKIRNITDANGNHKRKTEFIVDKAYCSHKHRRYEHNGEYSDLGLSEDLSELDISPLT